MMRAFLLIKEAKVKFRNNRAKGGAYRHPNANSKKVNLPPNNTQAPIPAPKTLTKPQNATNMINQKTPLKYANNTDAPTQGSKSTGKSGYFDRAKKLYNGLSGNQKLMAKGAVGLGIAGLAYGALGGSSAKSNQN